MFNMVLYGIVIFSITSLPVVSVCLWAGAISAASTATTVVYPDAQAVANARKGYEQSLKEAQAAPPPAPKPSRAQLVRVNSVPVLSTPPDKIRRTNTMDPGNSATCPSSSEPGDDATRPAEAAAAPEAIPKDQRRKMDKKEKKRLKREKRRARTEKKKQQAESPDAAQQSEQNEPQSLVDQDPGADTHPEVPTASVPTASPYATVPGPSPSHVTHEPVAQANAARPVPTSSRMTATKAAAKPKREDDTDNATGPKPEISKQSTDDQIVEAQHANLRRANTDAQHTPRSVATPQHGHEATPQQASQANAQQAPQANTQSGCPIEQALDKSIEMPPGPSVGTASRAVKVEQRPANSQPAAPVPNPAPPVVSPPPTAPAVNPRGDEATGGKRVRREKTPAEKAAHARYMKFSRSFERHLTPFSMSIMGSGKTLRFKSDEVRYNTYICIYIYI